MKIVQINTRDIRGGAARAAYRLHRGLRKIGQESRMLVREKASDDDSVFYISPKNEIEALNADLFQKTAVQGHYINAHRSNKTDTVFSFPYPGYDLSDLSILQTADVVNLHWVAFFQSPVTLHKMFALGKPVVWTLHDQWPFTGGCHYSAGCEKYRYDCAPCPQLSDDRFNLPAAILKDKIELFKDANLTIVTPSKWLETCVNKSILFKNKRVKVIPNSLDVNFFRPLPKAQAKENMGFGAETFTLLFAAEKVNEKRKGFQELTAAFMCCLKDPEFQNLVKNNKVRLLCMGHPSKKLEAAGLPVFSLGYLNSDEEIREAYAAADIFILPSLEDNLPNTMLEAMSCGTPVVAFDVGGIPDVIANGVNGQLVHLGDVNQMKEAIFSLIFNPNQLEIMGIECRKTMVENFSLTFQADSYLELYRELLGKNNLSPQAIPDQSTSELKQTQGLEVALATEPLSVYLESSVGHYYQKISDQVLLKSLKEFALNREKALRSAQEKIQGQKRHINHQSAQLQDFREKSEKYRSETERKDHEITQKDLQLKKNKQKIDILNNHIQNIFNSHSYRVGHLIIFPFTLIKRFLKKLMF